MLKVGIIGLGGMGTAHSNCLEALGDKVIVSAVADLVPEKREAAVKRFGTQAFETGEDLIKNADVDAVFICLPTYLHAEHAALAMKKGIHVFCEKPLCLTEEEADMLVKVQQETGVKAQVGQVIRFYDEFVWLKNIVQSRKYGKVCSGVFTRLSPNPKWSWENWFNKPELSGTMATDLHVHDVDYIRYLMGEPDDVSSSATYGANGVLNQIFTTYKFGDAIITSEGCWDYPDDFPFQMGFRVRLEKASVVFSANELTVYPEEGGCIKPDIKAEFDKSVDMGINVSDLGAYYNEVKYFIECIEKDVPIMIAPLSEGAKSLELVLKEIELSGGKTK